MAHNIDKTIKVKIPASKIWEVLGDYSSVERFALTIKSSPVISEKSSGLGAKRLCTFNNGSTLVEEIIEYQEGECFKMELSEFSLPLKKMEVVMGVKEIDANTCDIYMSSEFVVKGGPFGWLMGSLLMRPMMKGVFKKLLSGLAYHCVTGKLVDGKLPPKNELDFIVHS